MPDLPDALTDLESASAAFAAATRVGVDPLTDDLLVEAQRRLAGVTRAIETGAALLAAEVQRRSAHELGYSGLAQRLGARTPEALVQQTSGATLATARRLVRVGTLLADLAASEADPAHEMAQPWLAPAVAAVSSGDLSTEAIDAIRAGLGDPTDNVSPDALADATAQLTASAAHVTLERLAAMAREMRDDLDAEGVRAREQERLDRRYLRLVPQLDGMTRITGLLDPESAAIVTAAVDAATSPRRGGPRFTKAEDVERAEALLKDERTTGQIALDALVEMVHVAARASEKGKLGGRPPAVRVLVTRRDLDARAGIGFIEGQSGTVSMATVERNGCDGGYAPILFGDDGESLNLGHTKRLHNDRQRTVIGARDGGCLAPDCERPASWCEVHHIHEYSKGGKTDLSDGVLLCRYHHMLVHNNGWHVERDGGQYWMIPPPEIDPARRPIELHTKSPALRRLLKTG